MSSTIFHDVGTSLLASNSMYANLLADIMPSVEPYSPKEKIVIDVYETVDSDDFARTLTENGFRKYVNSLLSGLLRQHISRFFYSLCFC